MEQRCLGCMEMYSVEYSICPHCGHISGSGVEESIHMEPGVLLKDRYIIGKVLGYGGFGVTYIAWDGKLMQKVAIKEYLPSEFSTRMPGQTQITVFNGEKGEQFCDGLKKFVEEARHLAKFQNEDGIVKIYDSFELNDTAYIVMEYLDGITLTEYMRENGTIDEDTAVAMLMPIMKSLMVVHEEGLLHRDIAPDNVFITRSGDIKLIDFGASRYATTSHSRSLTVIIKPGYSPEEQYRSRGDQGPHTDVYALAATLYKMITGKTPPDAMERRAKYETQSKDIIIEPHKINKKISLNRENAILNAMNVRIEDRTPDVQSFINELEADKPAKRRYGKIKKIDIYSWPIWAKIIVPVLAVAVITGGVWLALVGINSLFSEERTVLDGYTEVPNLIGMTKEEADAALEEKNLLAYMERGEFSPFIEPGKITYQNPPAGSQREAWKTTVTYKLSLKNESELVDVNDDGSFDVENLVGYDALTATARLEAEGIAVIIKEEPSDTVEKGIVISQDKTLVKPGETITLIVSSGYKPFKMADVTGMSADVAETKLTEQGLIVLFEYKNDNNVAEGTVLSQIPAANEDVQKNDEVTIVVSSGKEIVSVPSVEGKDRTQAITLLNNAGFKVVETAEWDIAVAKGKVIYSSPSAGSAQEHGSEVVICISQGKKPIKVNYDANGGSVSPTSETKYYGDTYGTLPTPTKQGWIFVGWYVSKEGTDSAIGINTEVYSADHTLYARWSAGKYTLTLNPNGGVLENNVKKVNTGESYGMYLDTPTRTGYTFKGWYTQASGGTKISGSDKISNGANHTIYAQWTAKKYTVSFDSQGGSDVADKVVTYNSTYGTLPTPSKTGYNFNGWYDVNGSKVTSSTKVTTAESHTLYARWTATAYKLTFNANGGSVSTSEKSVAYNAQYGTLPTPTRSYYTFDGWYTSASGGTKVSSSTKMAANNVTVYAHWTLVSYKVSWSNVTGCTIAVKRTSSPNAGAATGTINSGAAIYYGDVLSVTYTASSGYAIDSKGATSITVTGNVTSANIYAVASQNTYTYNIKYVSTNGTNLGSTTATYERGTTNTITPPAKSGYTTPAAQKVAWDSVTPKTITFKYTPASVAFTEKSATVYVSHQEGKPDGTTTIQAKAVFEYRNRTADSVEIRVKWTDTLTPKNSNYYSFNAFPQYCNFKVGSKKTKDVCVVPRNTWSSASNQKRSKTAYSEWIEVPLSTTNKTNVDVVAKHWALDGSGNKCNDFNYNWSVAIPAY